MDKKQIVAIVDGIIAKVMSQNQLDENEARAMVGIALKKNTDALVAAITNPTLSLAS